MVKYNSLLVVNLVIIALFLTEVGFSQDARKEDAENKQELLNVMSESFKKALVEVEQEKALEKEEIEENISKQLNNFVDSWLKDQNRKRNSQINGKIENDWQDYLVPKPDYRDYYLRDFLVSLKNKDIIGSDSVPYPYNGFVDMVEQLYVEQTPLVNMPRSDYQYTVVIETRINLRYQKSSGSWNISGVEISSVSLNRGWPQQIQHKLGSLFVPKN